MRWHGADLWLGTVIATAVASLVWLLTLGRVDTSETAYRRLHEGMTPAQVEKITGTPGEDYLAFHSVSMVLDPDHVAEGARRFHENNSWIDRRYTGSTHVIEVEFFGRRGEERSTMAKRKSEINSGLLLGLPATILLAIGVAELTRAVRRRRQAATPGRLNSTPCSGRKDGADSPN